MLRCGGSELVASPDVLILDEPMSGERHSLVSKDLSLNSRRRCGSLSVSKVASVLHAVLHD